MVILFVINIFIFMRLRIELFYPLVKYRLSTMNKQRSTGVFEKLFATELFTHLTGGTACTTTSTTAQCTTGQICVNNVCQAGKSLIFF